jgi:fructose-bisphosphate aldolase class II
MLVSLNEVLTDARKGRYAVPAFDCCENVMVRTILETAEELNSPVILMCFEMQLEGNGWAYLPGLIRLVAEHHRIPIVLHLDHAETLDQIKRAVDCGFSSVMIDGSILAFEENVALTKAAGEIAHPKGIDLEGELGHVGGMDLEDTQHRDSALTEPDEVSRFVEQTGVDALAVSIGTAHGVYKSLPQLNIERLKELNVVSGVPLVMHGGSGTPDEQVREAVSNGICKLNIFADSRIAMFKGLKESAKLQRPDPLPEQLFGPMKDELAKTVAEKITLLGAGNRA